MSRPSPTRLFPLFSLAVLAVALGACASSDQKTTESAGTPTAKSASAQTVAFNTACPYSARPVSEAAPTREYHGKTIGFCCNGCPARWDQAADVDRDAMLAQMAAK